MKTENDKYMNVDVRCFAKKYPIIGTFDSVVDVFVNDKKYFLQTLTK